MPNATATAAPLTMQGQAVPKAHVDPRAFMAATRRQVLPTKTIPAFAGLGSTDQFSLLATGVATRLTVQIYGSVLVTPGSGTVATTARWPYDLMKACRVAVNGQANLINCSGSDLKAREQMALGDLTDRGIIRNIGGASPGTAVQQSTLSLNNEAWGLGQNVTGVAAGTYNFDLSYTVPLAMDDRNMVGALFLQTTSTEVAVAIDWAQPGDLFVLTSNATAVMTATVIVEAWVYTIPQASDGGIIIPDLSAFHSLIKTRVPNIAIGPQELKLIGQGVGRQLMRIYGRTFNGSPSTPLPVTATNYGQVGYRFGGNDTPELYPNGRNLSYQVEKVFNTDLGSLAGYWVLDFCSEFALRDSIDEGLASELRVVLEIAAGVTILNSAVEYVQETIFLGTAGA